MKAIFVRSPYSIVVNNATQVETKLELYLWNKPNVSPLVPTYTFSALIPSLTHRTAYYNIASECQEFIENINPNYTVSTEQNNMFAYAKAISYYRTVSGGAWIQDDSETFICLYGYSEYSQGVNYSIEQEVTMLNSGGLFGSVQNIPINNNDLKFTVDTTATKVDSTLITVDKYWIALDYSSILDPYINVLIQGLGSGSDYSIVYQNAFKTYTVELAITESEMLIKIPLEAPSYTFDNPYTVSLKIDSLTVFSRGIIPTCETKYTPLLLSFINKLGGWENMWLMKLSETTITAKGTDYNLSPSTFNYNKFKGQSKSFNRNGKKVIKANTGWIDENSNSLLTELMMSETILLSNEPVLLKTESQLLKQYVKERNINYALEFEYKSNLINTVV
jgi:hypothetical protein